MVKDQNLVTFKGQPITLVGPPLVVGMPAPDFIVVDNDLNPVTLADFKGQVLVLSTLPSLDTPVCDLASRRFNQEAQALGDKVKILVVSMDLPFAQKRWCASAGIDKVQTLSDYQQASLGQAYGVLIDGLRLLARAVFVINAQGQIAYIQIVPELTQEPDYAQVLQAVQQELA